MRAGRLLLAGLILLGAASPLWAGPFSEVPSDHWAYRACARLAANGLLGERKADFSGAPRITRFEFAVALLGPLSLTDEAAAALPADADGRQRLDAVLAALPVTPRQSESEIAGELRDLRRLALEFRDVLDSLGLNTERVAKLLGAMASEDGIRNWRLRRLARPAGAAALAASGGSAAAQPTTVSVPLAHGTVGLSLANPEEAPELLDYLAKSSASARPLAVTAAGPAEPAITDPRISRLRTSYEYGIGSALTLSLGYEEIARRGQGLVELDAASLTSLGIGYQLTPSTSVKLSYSLLEYSNYALDTPPVRDRVAETAVSIEF
ncbi:MAG: hypothetical protein ACE149_01420 [Armatimonadota bacterium]